jgi:hypothetical protein
MKIVYQNSRENPVIRAKRSRGVVHIKYNEQGLFLGEVRYLNASSPSEKQVILPIKPLFFNSLIVSSSSSGLSSTKMMCVLFLNAIQYSS